MLGGDFAVFWVSLKCGVFRSPKFRCDCRCMCSVRFHRNRPIHATIVMIFEGELESLRRFKLMRPEVRNVGAVSA
jgi:hypothetical protein